MTFLTDAAKHDLLERSGLTMATVVQHALHSGSEPEVRAVLGFGAGRGLIIPYPGQDGYARVRLDTPRDADRRYLSPQGSRNHLFIPKHVTAAQLQDPSTPLWITEAEKKALKAAQDGLVCIGMAGVWGWRTTSRGGYRRGRGQAVVISDLDAIAFAGRTVYLVFDSDATSNDEVRRALHAFARELTRRGAQVFHVPLPGGPDGQTVGLDDYLVTHTVEALCAIEPIRIPLADAWPAPEPVPTALLPVPAFDGARLLPAALAAWVDDVAERAQCPPDLVGVGAVVSAAAVIGRQLTIRPKVHDDWTVVPNLWGLAIGPPGMMKTAAMQEAQRGLRRLIAEARARHQGELEDYEFRVIDAKARRGAIEDQMKAAAKRGASTESFREAFEAATVPEPPVERRYVVNDATVEKLGALLNLHRNGLLLFRDELSGFLRTMDREGHENDRAFYCEAWNGTGGYVYDRIGRGTLAIEAACISILGGIQPLPLGAYLREAFGRGQDDGLIQRFQLMVYPDGSPTWRNVDRWPDSTARSRVVTLFQALDALDSPALAAHRDGADDPPFLHFTPEAQARFDTWRADLEQRLRGADEHPVFLSHLAKYRSLMPSLALVIHVINCVDGGTGGAVSERATEQAIAWCAYLEPHARRVYEGIVAPGRLAAASLARRLEAGALESPFTSRDVRRKGWAGLALPEEILPALDQLEVLSWVRRETVRNPDGGRPSIRFHVNPALRGGR